MIFEATAIDKKEEYTFTGGEIGFLKLKVKTLKSVQVFNLLDGEWHDIELNQIKTIQKNIKKKNKIINDLKAKQILIA